LLEAQPHGRLFAVDLKTGQFRQLADQLYYSNGVALSPQEDYLLVNETYRYRIRRVWLKGPKAGTTDIFADNLPGFPDGLSRDPQTDNYWAAMYTTRNPAIDMLHPHPWVKAQLAKLPRALWPKPKHFGMVVVLNPQGNIVDTLQDPSGTIFAVSSARRFGNQLYLGSLHGGFAGRLNLHTTELSAK
jgi:sugar lactone lactonase YvrE